MLELFALGWALGLPALAASSRNVTDYDGQGYQPQYQPQYAPPAGYPQQTMRQQYAGHAQEVRIRKAADGHFYAQATIEGAQTMALIDTGATGVVIGNRWLQAIGWDPSSGNYSMPVRTGNGTVYVHRLELPEITVAGLTIRDVDAIIHPPGSSTPDIIGMSFFNKLRSVQMANGELILRG